VIANSLPTSDAPTTAYLTEAALNRITERILGSARGTSGKLRAVIQPDARTADARHVATGCTIGVLARWETSPPRRREPACGTFYWRSAMRSAGRQLQRHHVLPFSAKQRGKVGLYYVGNWPSERRFCRSAEGAVIRIRQSRRLHRGDEQNADTPVSDHFKLRTFSPTTNQRSGRSTWSFSKS
jgi:hypothetical protein